MSPSGRSGPLSPPRRRWPPTSTRASAPKSRHGSARGAGWRHRASIKDPGQSSSARAEPCRDFGAEARVDVGGHRRRGGERGPDRPDGLIGEGQAGGRRGEPVQSGELVPEDVDRASGVALGARLADAVDRREPLLDEPLHLAGEVGLAFVPEAAALAVADEDERDAGVLEHRCGHFAGEGPLLLDVHVLRGERDPRARERGADAVEGRERRRDDEVDLEGPWNRDESPRERRGRRRRARHLPVGDEETAPGSQRKASTPGSFSPATRSSEAPPPVDTCEIFAARPASFTASTLSPPPTTVKAEESASICATARVPASNGFVSKTPMGPFQKIVFASLVIRRNMSIVLAPMSNAAAFEGIAFMATVWASPALSSDGATTKSEGRTS